MARDPLSTGLSGGSGGGSSSSDPLGTGDFMKNLNSLSSGVGKSKRTTLAQYQPTIAAGGDGAAAQPATAGSPVSSVSLNPAFNPQPTSGAPLAYQPVTGNSLDQYMRSMMNLLGGQGFGQYESGQYTLGSGLNLMSQPAQFWQAILSGDPSASQFIHQALAPTISNIGNQYATAGTTIAQNAPRGGYAASAQADMPYAQARDVSGLYSQMAQLVPQAATSLAGMGESVGQLGLSESSQGLQQLFNALQGILSKAGLNVQETGNLLGMI
jgi:hypothetical protein